MRKMGYTKLNNPPNYYRSGLSRDDLRRVMEGVGPLSAIQIVALVSDIIPPEAKVRYCQLHVHGGGREPKTEQPIEKRMFAGVKALVLMRLKNIIAQGKVRKHGAGKDATYEWVSTEADRTKKDSPGRRHAKSRRS